MFCTACGTAIPAGQAACAQCGQPVPPFIPPVPGIEYEVERYRSGIRVLAIVWFVYAGLALLLGSVALVFARHFLMGGTFPHGRIPPWWFNTAIHFGWIGIVVRAGLSFLAGYGLIERAQWGKVVAIIVAILSLIHFPLGTALGIWTLIMLLGYRNSALYQRL